MFNKTKIKASISKELINLYLDNTNGELPICKAPFSSLYFSPSGEVGACCLNKSSYFYGKYPESSIREIVKSIPRKLQQKYISENNFSLGCQICEENLIANNFSGLMASCYKNNKSKDKISQIDFELSHECNFDCIMCDRDKNQKDTIYGNDFIKELKPYLKKLNFANFVGGEPFIIEQYYLIWDEIFKTNKNCIINVQTNGSVLNERILQLLKHPNFHVSISIDSIREENYNIIRRGGKLLKTLNNFTTFNSHMKLKNTNMRISVCPLTLNWNEIPEILDFANTNNCEVFFNHVTTPANISLKYLSSVHFKRVLDLYENFNNKIVESNILISKNKIALNGLICLLQNWQSLSIDRSANSLLVNREQIIQLVTQKFISINSHISIWNKIIENLPSQWYVSLNKMKKIENFDFESRFAYYKTFNADDNNILNDVWSFFEVENIENLLSD